MNGPGLAEAPPWEPSERLFEGRASFQGYPEPGMKRERRSPGITPGLTRRGLIYEYVRGHPGSHVRAMARDLSLGTGDLQYHLLWLERHGLIKTRKGGFYRFVFPTMVFREDQELLLGVLSQETPRDILLCLIGAPQMTQGDIARALDHSQPTISWHMERLAKAGLVRKERTNGGAAYVVAADREDVLSFVRSYHPEAWRRWVGRLAHVVEGGARKPHGARMQMAGLMPPAVVELVGSR